MIKRLSVDLLGGPGRLRIMPLSCEDILASTCVLASFQVGRGVALVALGEEAISSRRPRACRLLAMAGTAWSLPDGAACNVTLSCRASSFG